MKSWHLIYLTVIFSASIISCDQAPVPNPTPPGVETGGATDGGSSTPTPGAKIIAHEHASLDLIPSSAIAQTKASVSIYYGHTSHGSQLMSGMDGLDAFKGGTGLYEYNTSGSGGALAVVEGGNDAGYYPAWRDQTITYLGAANASGRGSEHPEVNVVMWSWCGQLSGMEDATLRANYLEPMAALETAYTGVRFVYFTGHLDGTGTGGTLNRNNDAIRAYCRTNGKWLYDFADIESHDPDGTSYLALNQNDACAYDSDGNGSLDRNWATEWQAAHSGAWYECSPAHAESAHAMGNRKAYAAWYLFARLAGWEG